MNSIIKSTAGLGLSLGFACLMPARATDTPASGGAACREESLIRFVSQGRDMKTEKIGVENSCDHFGGDLVYTPKHGLYLYVNFNIAGVIDVDALEQSLERHARPDHLPYFKGVQYAVVSLESMRRRGAEGRDAYLNPYMGILFISEKALSEGRLPQVWREFFSLKLDANPPDGGHGLRQEATATEAVRVAHSLLSNR